MWAVPSDISRNLDIVVTSRNTSDQVPHCRPMCHITSHHIKSQTRKILNIVVLPLFSNKIIMKYKPCDLEYGAVIRKMKMKSVIEFISHVFISFPSPPMLHYSDLSSSQVMRYTTLTDDIMSDVCQVKIKSYHRMKCRSYRWTL